MGAEDRLSEVEDRTVKINETERKKEKRIRRNEDKLRDIWDNVKCPNIQIIGVPQEEVKKKDRESRWRRNRTGDHFLFYKFIERTTER